MAVDDIENLNYDSLEAVAHLRASERYQDIMQACLTTLPAVRNGVLLLPSWHSQGAGASGMLLRYLRHVAASTESKRCTQGQRRE